MRRRPSVVLGASGLVGQRMQQRLHGHPWFELVAVGGSALTAGKKLDEVEWRLEQARPELPNLVIHDILDSSFVQDMVHAGIEIAFSCLPSNVAAQIESKLADVGIAVFSNASHHRGEHGIPLVIPDINPSHMSLYASSKGPHACGTNCTLVSLAVPLAALRSFGIQHVSMRSEQALSGAGWKLLMSEEALAGDHEAEIPGEAEKIEHELLHVMGSVSSEKVSPADFEIDVKCQRVSRKDGHQVFVDVQFHQSVSLEDVKFALRTHAFNSVLKSCPSTPHRPIHLVERIDVNRHLWSNGTHFLENPDPSLELKAGMAVVVGEVRMTSDNTVSFTGYSHNTIRGAAGGTLLLAEQAFNEGRLREP